MRRGCNHFDFITSLQAYNLVLLSIHQGDDSPSELNMIFFLKKKKLKGNIRVN
jgi:hypothetical protein